MGSGCCSALFEKMNKNQTELVDLNKCDCSRNDNCSQSPINI